MKDPIEYAQNLLLKQIDESNYINDTYKFAINGIKKLIQLYFSDELQNDETPMGALKRNQIRKELVDFANR
jgi:hypothetical protein